MRTHPLAFKAAEATHCAGEQGKYHEMHGRLFQHQRALEPWSGHAEALGLDVDQFNACMEEDKYAAAVRHDMAQAGKVGATGTPSFVLARTDPEDPKKVIGLTFIRGAQPLTRFQAEIDKALGDAGQPARAGTPVGRAGRKADQ